MPNTRMITLTNILDKKLETMGANNSDISKMISKIVVDTELNDIRQYHISQYELYKKSYLNINKDVKIKDLNHIHMKYIFYECIGASSSTMLPIEGGGYTEILNPPRETISPYHLTCYQKLLESSSDDDY